MQLYKSAKLTHVIQVMRLKNGCAVSSNQILGQKKSLQDEHY